MGVTIISPTPGVQAGQPGGFPLSESAARDTPIVVEITSTSAERVELASPGEPDMSKRLIYRNGALQGTWVLRSTKTNISGGVRLSILPEKGWTPNVLRSLSLAIDVVASGGNIPPVADFTWALGANRTIQFTDASSDPDGTVTGWAWTFGDAGTSSLQNPSHAYAAGGSYSVGLTVTDNLGGVSPTTTKTVYVWWKDATSLKGMPLTNADWTGVLAYATTQGGTYAGNPSALYDFGSVTSPSSTVTDGIGSRNLTLSDNAGAYANNGNWTYQQAVASWTAGALKSLGGNHAEAFNTTFPNINAGSYLALVYMLPTIASVGAGSNPTTLMRMGTAFDDDNSIEVVSPPSTNIQGGNGSGAGRTTSSATYATAGGVRPYSLRGNITANAVHLITDQEKTSLGVQAGAGTELWFGGDFSLTWYADACLYLAAWVFLGAAAEIADASYKILLQALGWTIPWS